MMFDIDQSAVQEGAQFGITPAMIEAGLDALSHSGAVETPLVSDQLLVIEIYHSMATCRLPRGSYTAD